jgi:single-stranded-DNA-specific exonuclease
VAFGSPPKVLEAAAKQNHDIALRLERNRWNGVVEPRTILRALCPTQRGELRVLGEDGDFWARLRTAIAAAPEVPATLGPAPVDRRREGFAGVAGDLFTSGEPVLVAVADVERRREGLELIVAGLADGGMPVAAWSSIAAQPELAAMHGHVVALDPPPGGVADPLLRLGPAAHLAWGPAEAEFALQVWRSRLDLRPALAGAYRALRDAPPGADAHALRHALQGAGRYPRDPETCARLVQILGELGLVEFDAERPACRVIDGVRAELERSVAYRACLDRLAGIERALAAELPAAAPARAA